MGGGFTCPMSTSLSSPAVAASELESEEDSLDEESPISLALGAPAASSAAVKSLMSHSSRLSSSSESKSKSSSPA
ncbi:hypothetical protein PC123_g1405 [Phytophthora cactorum]|nr:hypothetical protein PC123_g1405 [Phytophthora cactorum]